MATTPITEKNTSAPSETLPAVTSAAPKKINSGKAVTSKNSVSIDVLRKDIARVEVVDTDFVIIMKSTRKILIRDGALNAVTDEDFSITFSDAEEVPGKVLFSETEADGATSLNSNWSDGQLKDAEMAAALVVPVAASGVSWTVLGVGLAVAAAGGGGGGGAGAQDNTQAVKDAQAAIVKFAQENTESLPVVGGYKGVAPIKETYETAGILGVTAENVTSINDALATAVVTGESVSTAAKLQQVVNAYIKVLNAANIQADGGGTLGLPTGDDYTLIGVTGVEVGAALRDSKVKLLSDVIDRKALVEVDTVKEIQLLADIVIEVIVTAKDGRNLSKEQLDKLGITGVTADNLSFVLKGIQDTADDGTGVDTFQELQNIVGKAPVIALSAITKFAKDNTDSSPTLTGSYQGLAPSVETYKTAGIIGITETNVVSINDALATSVVTDESVSTVPRLQSLVNAYLLVLAAANGQADKSDSALPTGDDFTLIGVKGLELNTALRDARVKLLSQVIDRKMFVDVDTVKEIQTLSEIVSVVMDTAKDGGNLSKIQLEKLGITGLSDNNFALVLRGIQETLNDGSEVDTVAELQNIVDRVNGGTDSRTALQAIVDFAQDNSDSQPIVLGSFSYKGTPPTPTTYLTAGITGSVGAEDAAAFNDALATLNVTADSVRTIDQLQALVNAYRKVLGMADGIGGNSTIADTPTLLDYQLLGVEAGNLQTGANSSNRVRLLNDIVDAQVRTGVDRIAEINQLIKIANAVQDKAAGLDADLTLTDFTALGIRGVTSDNLSALIAAIGRVGADASDTLLELQNLLYINLSLAFDAISEDRGYRSDDFVTSDNILVFSGSSNAADGTKIILTLKRANQDDIMLGGEIRQGRWQVSNGATLADADYTVSAQLFDGNTPLPKVVTFGQHVVVDTRVDPNSDPGLINKTIAITAIIDDTGASDSDFITSDTTLSYIGVSNAADGTHVAVKIDGVLQWTVVQSGKWTLDNTGAKPLTAGDHTIEAYLTDAAGNQAGASAIQKVTINTADLTLLSKTSGPIGSSSDLVLMFSASVNAVAGKYIVITDLGSPDSPWARIDASDTTQVRIDGVFVTINPTNDLLKGHQYRATVENGAFQTTAGAAFEGVSANAGWTFNAVDPSMEVAFAGNGIGFTDGINQAEFAANSLVVTGKISSTNLDVVTNARITSIKFTSADGVGSFELTTGLPTVTDFTWTLANNPSWTSQLVSGKTYTVSAQLAATVAGTAITTVVAQSVPVLVDKDPPVLIKVECDKTFLKVGDFATYTFTFSEDPKDSFGIDDLVVAQVGSLKVGTFLALSGTGSTRTALFRATDNVTFTPGNNTPTVTINAGSFKDAAGNLGTISTIVELPNLAIDTQGPTITNVTLSGIVARTGTEFTDGTLVDGDKVRVIVTMSEVTQVIGIPIFNIKVGNAIRQASYVRGSGSNSLLFEYTVALGDSDNSGGITADANSLSLGASRISDTADNTAVLDTRAVPDNTNKLIVVTTGGSTAFALIKAFAEANKDPANLVNTVAVPVVQDYKDAGVTGVTTENIDAINNSLATAVIDAAKIPQLQDLQNLVTAYNRILAMADGSDNKTNGDNPNYLQYGLIGVQGVDSVKASLLGDVIDFKNKIDVDTVAEIQDLANAVSAVMDQARNVSGLTLDQLKNKLNIQDVTADNFAAVMRDIADTPDDGSLVDTWPELQLRVSTAASRAASALLALQIFANANQDSLPTTSGQYTGTVPTWSTYTNTGVSSVGGITDANMTSLANDALATLAVTGDSIRTLAAVQNLVTAYGLIANLANGRGDTTDQPDANAYNLIGVQGFDPTLASSIPKARLLSDVIDRKLFADIDTVKEIQAMAVAVSAVMANAAGTGSVTVEQLKLLGFDVPANKIDAVVAAIAGTPHRDGSDVDTYIELSTLINTKLDAVDQAIRQIANFADQNIFSQPTPIGNFVYKDTPPTATIYNSVGLTGPVVTDAEAKAFNDALATSAVTYTSVDTKEEVQALVDAYRAVFKAADGAATATLIKPTLKQYALLGVSGLDDPDLVITTSRVSLLGDVIDRKRAEDVDTVLEIQALANIVNRVMNEAQSVDGLTREDLIQLGIQGVTPDNLAAVLQAIRDTPGDGTGVDTFVELQNLVSLSVTTFNAALQIIQNYAKAHTDPTQLGTDQPTAQTYLDLGITNVSQTNVRSMNSALATANVTEQQVLTAQAVQSLVDAYNEILAAANNTPDAYTIKSADYTLLGITGVVGSESKVRLLSDVIDRKISTAVDTADELQALANTVGAVMNSAAKAASGGLTSAQQLTDLGVKGVTNENFSKILAAIQGTNPDGSGVDTVIELQKLVNDELGIQATALGIIATFADSNTVSQQLTGGAITYKGIVPTRQTYLDAGVSGTVSADDAMSFNDALATNAITASNVSDTTSLQTLVDSYRKFFKLADGPNNTTTAPYLTSADCVNLGVETTISGLNRLNLLSDIVDRQSRTGIDTIAKINQLTLIANAVQDQATGQAPSYTLTAEDFTRLGVRGVGSSNLATLLDAIHSAGAGGSDSVPELQSLLFDNLSVDFKAISDDTGPSNSDFVTSDNTLSFSGTSNASDNTKIRIGLKRNSQTDLITLDGTVVNGQWQVSSAVLLDGDYTVSAQLFDGTTALPKVATFAKHVMVDTSAVNRPDGLPDTDLAGKTVSFTTISDDTGVQGDYTTSDTTLKFIGTSTAVTGTNVGISIDGGPVRYTKVLADGTWLFDNSQQTLTKGTYKVDVFLMDAAGNKLSTGGDSHNVTIDTSSLQLVNQTSGPIASSAKLQLTFSTDVVAVAGKFIHLTDEGTGSTIDIGVKDAQVSISGTTVTVALNGTNQMVPGKSYHATIDADAFRSTAGASFDGLLSAQSWTFQTVDPSTTITLSGTGVDASNGINAAELGAFNISGVASSTSWVSVRNPKVTQITFTSSDSSSPHVVTIDTDVTIGSDRTWSLANDTRWSSQLISGKTYTVKARIESDISDTHQTSFINITTPLLVDTAGPGLTITSDVTQLGIGQFATFTFTFDEAPVGFNIDDIGIGQLLPNGTPIGSLSNFRATSDPKVFTVAFTAVSDVSLPSPGLINVLKGSYTDAAGNTGKSDATNPTVLVDTRAPAVTRVDISGADSTGANKSSNLDVGDKVKITLTLSEITTVGASSSPIITFDLGGVSKIANYASGSGSTQLVFFYTVVNGDNDNIGGLTASANSLTNALLLDRVNNVGGLTTPAAVTNSVVVDTTASSLDTLAKAAQANNASTTLTPLTVYQKAGALRLSANNLDSYNSALNSDLVKFDQANTTQEVQDIVDAYNTILNLADGTSNSNSRDFATDAQYQLIGITGLDNPTTVLRSDKAQLLSDAIDRKNKSDVNEVAEVQALADAVIAVMRTADNDRVLTKAQLETLGVLRVTDTNLPLVLAAIAGTRSNGVTNGGAVNTVAKLQALVDQGAMDAIQAAITLISNFAGDNTISSTTGTGVDFSYAVRTGATKPDVVHYVTAGVTDVTANNLNAINDALATPNVTGFSTSTASGIQKVVDAYRAVLALADGVVSTGTALQIAQFNDIGVNIGNATNGSNNLTLLNSVLDFKSNTDVDTVEEINILANTVNAIMNSTGKRQASSASFLTAANLTKLGMGSVNDTNIAGIRESIAAQPNGANIDTRGKLQLLVNFYVAPAPGVTLAVDTGVNNQDGRTKDARLNFGLPSFGGASTDVSIDGGATYIRAADYAAPRTSGTYTALVRQVSAEGFLGQTRSLTFTYDGTLPEVIKLNTNTNSNVDTVNYGASDFGSSKLIAPNMQQASDGDIAVITLTVGGANLDADSFTYRTTGTTQQTVSLKTDIQPTLVTIGDVSGVSLKFSATTQTFEFSSNSSSRIFTNAQVQAIEKALGFSTTSRTNSERTFTFSHTDVAGNSNVTTDPATTGVAKVTFKVDSAPPGKVLFTSDLQTEFGFYNNFAIGLSAAVAIAANIKPTTDTDIAKIQVIIGGAGLKTENDRILFGNGTSQQTVDLRSDGGGSGLAIGNVTGVTWKYTASSKTLVFSLTDNSAFKDFQIASLEASLLFQSLPPGSNNTQGDRTFTFDHIDLVGFSTQSTNSGATKTITVDYTPPPAVDLDGNTTGVIDATSLQYFNQSIANSTQTLLIAPKMSLQTGVNDIAKITVALGVDALSLGDDQFVIDGVAVVLNTGNKSATNNTIAGVPGVTWLYSATDKTFSFTKEDKSSFTPAQVQALESKLAFKTNGNSQGDRTFTFTHVDQAGNSSANAVATVKVDTLVPEAIDLDADTPNVQSTDVQYMKNATVAGVLVASKIKKADRNENITSIKVVASEVISADNDKLAFGSASILLDTTSPTRTDSSGSITLNGVTGAVQWTYAIASKTLTFSKQNNAEFLAAEVQTIEKALSFQTTTNAVAGDRVFTFTHSDLAGNNSASAAVRFGTDVKASVIKLSAPTAALADFSAKTSNATTQISLTDSLASVIEEDRVASLQIRVRGLRAGSAEKIVINNTEIDASGAGRSGSVTTAGSNVIWNWNYNNALGAFVFSTPTTTTPTNIARAADVEAFLRSLSYKASIATPGDDVRQFFISTTDGIGNTSQVEVASSLTVNAVAPAKHATNSAAVLDGNATDQLISDQIVLTFTEPVKVSSAANMAAWTVTGGSLGTGAGIRAVDSVTVNGEAYATNFLVTTGNSSKIVAGQAQSLTLSGGLGGDNNYANLGAAVLPTFTLNSKAITLETWVYVNYDAWPSGNNQAFPRLFDFSTDTAVLANAAPNVEIWFGFNRFTGNLAFEYINGVTTTKESKGVVSMTTSMPLKTWQHAAVTVSGQTVSIYLNGKLQTPTANTLTAELATNILFDNNFIGKSNWIQDGGFAGSFFDSRVYTYARNATEIANDYRGMFDPNDPKLLFQYSFNGNANNGATNQVLATEASVNGSRNATITNTGANFASDVGATTIKLAAANVVDAAGTLATADQTFQLYKKSLTAGSGGNETIVGTAGNDFIAGQGGIDVLTGGGGADIFAWFLGETGNNTVTDFKVSEGDMVDLSSLMTSITLGTNDTTNWDKYLRLIPSASGNDMVLSIDATGGSFVTTTMSITFTNGALNGLNNTLPYLVEKRIINLTAVPETPLVFDLNGDGVRTLSVSNGVAFDVQGQGSGLMKTGWTDGKDGLLVLDLNGDGKINDGTELFGGSTKLANGSIAKDGFEALKQYDSNQDNVIDVKDAVFSNLKLWVDTNHDAITDSGELHSLSEFNVLSINLNANNGSSLDNGNLFGLMSNWTSTDGQTHQLTDVWFNTTHLTTLENMVTRGQKVDMTAPGKTSYDLRLNDVLSSPEKTVVITADANDVVQMNDTGWTNTGTSTSINNHTYNLWENGSAQLLVDQLARVNAVL